MTARWGTFAEVRTPAVVVVWAHCPECHVAQPIDVYIGSELRVTDDEGSELRLRVKSKAKAHVCGQLPLAVEQVDGQESLPLSGEDTDAGEAEA